MNKAYFLPLVLATAVTSVAFAYDDVYTNVFTGVTSVTALPDGLPGAEGASWSKEGVVALTNVNDNAVGFESEGAAVLKLTVTETPQDQNTIFRVTVTGTVEEVETLITPEYGVQTAFAVCTNGTSESCFWAWDGAEWQGLGAVPDGFDGSAPTNLTVEISYQGTNNTRKVRFAIGGEYLNSELWTYLVSGSAALTNDNLNAVGVNGSGTLAAVNGEVMLGVAELDGVKYGTLAEAIDEASENDEVAVLRPTDEDVDLTKNVTIADGGNGYINGDITVNENVTVDVVPTKDEFTSDEKLAGKSGTYTIPVKVTGGTVSVTLPDNMSNKEIVGNPTREGSTVSVTIQTSAKVLGDIEIADKTITNNIEKLREFLAGNSATTEAYVAADANATDIKAALETVGANDIPLYQSYELGIAQDDSVKPEPVGAGSDEDPANIKLCIPSIKNKARPGDFTVKYKVGSGEAKTLPADGSIDIPVAPGCTGSYPVTIVFE